MKESIRRSKRDLVSNSMKAMRVARGVSRIIAVDQPRALSARARASRSECCYGPRRNWDGSGWKGVYDILVKDGYNVSIVQESETSFNEDMAATRRVLAVQDGPSILVAHSYGGAVITEAGTDPSVAGLVYIAAHMPDAGENEADDGKRFPVRSRTRQTVSLTSTPRSFMSTSQPTCLPSRLLSWRDRRCPT